MASQRIRAEKLVGRKFGRLSVISVDNECISSHKYLVCRCDCGNMVSVVGCSLLEGKTKSCGCLKNEVLVKRSKTHGMTNTRIYQTYRSMRQRCINPNNKCYKFYGGKGITICQEWLDDFTAFYTWAMNNGYDDSLTIERKDVSKGYNPENCTWIPMSEQCLNRTVNHFVTYKGEKMTLSELARKVDVSCIVITTREEQYNYDYDALLDDFFKTHIKKPKGGKLTWQKLKSQQVQP